MKHLLNFLRPKRAEQTVETVYKEEPVIDMKAFSSWCHQLGVSRLANKSAEIVVQMGDRQKIVQLQRF